MARVFSFMPAAEDIEFAETEDSGLEEPIVQEQTAKRRFGPRVLGASAVALLLAAGVLAAAVARPSAVSSEEVGARSTELQQIVSPKATPLCSKAWMGDPADDCSATKCCKVSGYSCYEKKPGTYGCVEKCDPTKGWTCKMPHSVVPLVPVAGQPSAALYCVAVYTKNTGSSKPSQELDLLKQQYAKKVSLFQCDYNDVFSDVAVQYGDDGATTIQVHDVDNEFHVVKRKSRGTWVNTGMFKQVWKAMSVRQGLKVADWVVKVDFDAVFVPQRLKDLLVKQPVTWQGVYKENCPGVEYGFFGNLEVYSVHAFALLLKNIDSCSTKIDWVTGTKWGPIGEDLFAQMCMDYQGVSKIEDFTLTTDGACPGTRKKFGEKDNKHWKPPCGQVTTPAIHPFKKPAEYFKCLDETLKAR